MRRRSATGVAATLLVLAGIIGAPCSYAQQPSTPCAEPVSNSSVPHATAAQSEYRERLHAHATGAGVRVAVIDTGIARHAELPRLEAGADLVAPDEPNPLFDCDLHGTAVAGIIGSQATGIAPGATLISIRQSSSHYRTSEDGDAPVGTGSLRSLVDAINIALDKDADVINISLVSCLPPEAALRLDPGPLDEALRRAESQGTLIVAASGNTSTGCQAGHVVFPAHSPTVLAVEALDHSHATADYSIPVPPEATIPPLSAPGSVPLVLNPSGHGWIKAAERAGQEVGFQGTSFAAPVVSGTAALLKERYPGSNAGELRDIITAAADPSLGAVDPLSTLTHVMPAGDIPPRAKTVTPSPTPTPQAVRTSVHAGVGLAAAALLGLVGAALVRRPRLARQPIVQQRTRQKVQPAQAPRNVGAGREGQPNNQDEGGD